MAPLRPSPPLREPRSIRLIPRRAIACAWPSASRTRIWEKDFGGWCGSRRSAARWALVAPRGSAAHQEVLESSFRDDQNNRDRGLDGAGGQRGRERQRDRDRVEHDRDPALEIAAQRNGQGRFRAMMGDERVREDVVRDRRENQDDPVYGHRPPREMRLPHPIRDERSEREPEQE